MSCSKMCSCTEKLIACVRERPILYDNSHPQSRCLQKKIQAWREVVKEMECDGHTIEQLKIKWKNLKDTYRKYKLSRLGIGSQGSLKLSNWPWAQSMNFIDNIIKIEAVKEDNSRVKFEVQDDEVDNNMFDNIKNVDQDIDLSNESVIEFTVDEDLHHDSDPQETVIFQTDELGVKRKLSHQNSSHKMRKINETKVEIACDGTDLLFLGFADSYKQLSKRSQASIKFGIAKLLMKAEVNDMKRHQKVNPLEVNENE